MSAPRSRMNGDIPVPWSASTNRSLHRSDPHRCARMRAWPAAQIPRFVPEFSARQLKAQTAGAAVAPPSLASEELPAETLMLFCWETREHKTPPIFLLRNEPAQHGANSGCQLDGRREFP